MKVIGPNWPSKRLLQEALQDFDSEVTLEWGKRSMDGLQQLNAFSVHGVPTVNFTSATARVKSWLTDRYSVFGRKKRHTQGRDIVWAKNWTSIPPYFWQRHYWVQVYAIQDEFRCHVWAGKAFRTGKKVRTSEPPPGMPPIRNRRTGWTLDYKWGRSPENAGIVNSVSSYALAACKALDYVGGAVDILQDANNGRLRVLEVNSAPALRDRGTLKGYVERVKEWAGTKAAEPEAPELEETRMPHSGRRWTSQGEADMSVPAEVQQRFSVNGMVGCDCNSCNRLRRELGIPVYRDQRDIYESRADSEPRWRPE